MTFPALFSLLTMYVLFLCSRILYVSEQYLMYMLILFIKSNYIYQKLSILANIVFFEILVIN